MLRRCESVEKLIYYLTIIRHTPFFQLIERITFLKKQLSILLIQLCSIQFVHASAPQPVPTDLMYSNKPIDSLCFVPEKNNTEINLNNCGAKKNKLVTKGINEELSKQGYLGYDYKGGFSYYKHYPAGDNKYWIYTINNSGGSGQFTNIRLVQRKNKNTIVIHNIVGGDRCNGGIQDVANKNENLTFSANLTPFDVITLADKNIKVKPYDDLAECAVCCTAKSFYTVNSNAKPQLDYIEMNNVADVSEMPDQGTMQACFNKLYVSYIKTNSTKLTPEQLSTFANQFKQTCMK